MLASLAFTSWQLHPLLIAVLLGPLMFIFAYGYYHLLLRPLAQRSHFESTVGTVLVTVGTLMMLSDLTAKAAGATQRNIPLRMPVIEYGDIIISTTQLLILAGIVNAERQGLTRNNFSVLQLQAGQDASGIASKPIQARRVMHKDIRQGRAWRPVRQQIKKDGIIRLLGLGDMRPIAAPEHELRRRLHIGTSDGAGVRIVSGIRGCIQISPRQLDPGPTPVEKLQDDGECRI